MIYVYKPGQPPIPMTDTNLLRINALSSMPEHAAHVIACSILRAMCSSKLPTAKAYAITGLLRKLTEEQQDGILSALESLAPGGGVETAPS